MDNKDSSNVDGTSCAVILTLALIFFLIGISTLFTRVLELAERYVSGCAY